MNTLKNVPDYPKNPSIADTGREQGWYKPASPAKTSEDLKNFSKGLDTEFNKRVSPVSDERLKLIKAKGAMRRQERNDILRNRIRAGVGASAIALAVLNPTANEVVRDVASVAEHTVTDSVDRVDTWMNGPEDTIVTVNSPKTTRESQLPPLRHPNGE